MTRQNLPNLQWRKSSRSESAEGSCVEVARMARKTVAVRDSKNPGNPALALEPASWRGLLAAIKHS